MKKVFVFCVLLALWLSLDGSGVWAQMDVGWMQEGVRVWYFGAAGTENAEEAYLFASINGTTAQLTHHSGINYWSLPRAEAETGSILDQGPFWIHPQVLQTIAVGDNWRGIRIASMDRATYTYDTFMNNAEFSSIPYLLLPIKALFDLRNQRKMVKLVYGIPYPPYYDPVWGTAYFDAETGLCLFNLKLTASNTVWFILSEINYDFATHRAFAEDNGPHTGFKSNIIKTSSAANYVMIQSSVETRYGNTVQMWVSTSEGGNTGYVTSLLENYCFFGSVPVLRHKLMTATPHYPPEGWNEYGDYLWWWVPQEALQSSPIDIFDVSMTRTSTAPYTFAAAGAGTGLYFSNIIFDNDGYMTDFSARHSTIGLTIDLGPSSSPGVPIHLVDGLAYYRNTMGRATPPPPPPRTLTVTKTGPGTVISEDLGINCGADCSESYDQGTEVTLTAHPDADSAFAGWSGACSGTNPQCLISMNQNLAVTATFYSPARLSVDEGSIGTELTITGSGFGTKKGKVLVGGVAPKIAKDGWADDRIVCLMTKVPSPGGAHDIKITPYRAPSSMTLPGAFTVKPPEIDPLDTDHGKPLAPITVTGRFFTTKKGKVYVEDPDTGKKKTCKVTAWFMNPASGDSSMTFIVPKLPKLLVPTTYTLKITNKLGFAEALFTVEPSP
jgi:hypothetical protein